VSRGRRIGVAEAVIGRVGTATTGCILLVSALSGCVGGGEPRGSAREGGTLSVATGSAPKVLDPALAGEAADADPLWLVYTPPLTYRRATGPEGGDLVPGVAARLPTVSEDGRAYSFRVRRGLTYSNGTQVTARDVRHSIIRARRVGAVGRRLFAGVTAVAANDRTREVRITLTRPDPDFPHSLAATQAGVLPAKTPMRDVSGKPPPGVGPYRIGRVRRGRRVVLLRNRGFRLPGVPGGLVDALIFRQDGTPADQVEAVMAGQLDVMIDSPPPGRLPELRSEQSDRYFEYADLSTRYLLVDADRIPFSDPDLREAIALAIDKPEAARLLVGLVTPSCNLLPPAWEPPDDSCPWGDPEEHPDLVHARELVDESGAEGEPVLVHGTRADRPVTRMYVRTLRKIGLRARVARGRRADVTLATATSLVPDARSFLVPIARRVPLFVDPEAQLLADELQHSTDPDRAAQLAEQLDRQLASGGVVVPYAAPSRTAFLSARIDVDNCLLLHPVYGVDFAGLCLR